MNNLFAVPKFEPSLQDVTHENKIEIALQNHLYAPKQKRHEMWLKYTKLHSQRSPQMVAWMEAKQGLLVDG